MITRLFSLLALSCVAIARADLTLTILHTNDLHAHVESTMIKQQPYGGYARQATLVQKFRKSDPNTLLVSAGDTFQGTPYFAQYDGLADLSFLNALGYQAAALGNHEFDKGPVVLSEFVKRAQFPLLCCNLDFSNEPSLKDRVKASTIVNVGGHRIGLVGAITPDVENISSPGPTIRLKPLAESVQHEIDGLHAQHVEAVLLLTHIGYDEDQALAKQIHGAAAIVGGHSHTLLATQAMGPFGEGRGRYPTEVKDHDGKRLLIVQAYEWGKVVGRIKIRLNGKGEVIGYSDAAPILVDASIPEDPTFKAMADAFSKPLTALKRTVIGVCPNGLSREHPMDNGVIDTPIANVICDAMLESCEKMGAQIALMNQGGIRAGIEPGNVTLEQAMTVQPFANTMVTLELTGDELRKSIELGLADKGFLYVSRSTSLVYDPRKPAGSKIIELTLNGSPIEDSKTYKIVTNNFVARGGDGHSIIGAAKGKRVDTGIIDIDATVEYFKRHTPVTMKSDGRIRARVAG